MAEKIDVLYIHVPKFSSYYKPFDEYMFVNFVSMGLFALADLTEKAGFKTKIVHPGVEWICDNKFSILDYIAERSPDVVAVPIFWHPQSYDAVEVIRAIKKRWPEKLIVTGGFTASYFAEDIMRGVPEIDALVKGHGEASIVEIVKRYYSAADKSAVDLSNIPNTLWRKGGAALREVVENPETYFATTADLDALNFTNIGLLENYKTYMNSFRLNVAYSKRISREENLTITPVRSYHLPLFIGRGCPVECKLCAGRNRNQAKMNHSGCVVMRSPEKVCDSIEEISRYGFEQVIVCTDPFPDNPEYFVKLFRLVRERNIEIDMFFESWGLPHKDFIDEFALTFTGRNSAIAISAESGSEEVRRKIRGYHFTNERLFKTLDYLEEARVGFLVFFTVGNPFEKESDLDETERIIRKIKEEYLFVRWLTTYPVQLEPGSAIFEEPEKYGVEKELSTFMDYYNFHGRADSCLYTNLGYNIIGYFDDIPDGLKSVPERIKWFSDKISAIRCARFCLLHPDPEVARHYCDKLHSNYADAGYGSFEKYRRGSFV